MAFSISLKIDASGFNRTIFIEAYVSKPPLWHHRVRSFFFFSSKMGLHYAGGIFFSRIAKVQTSAKTLENAFPDQVHLTARLLLNFVHYLRY